MKHFVDIADFNTKKLNQIIKTAKQIKEGLIKAGVTLKPLDKMRKFI